MRIIVDVDILKSEERIPKKNSVKAIEKLSKRHDIYIKGDEEWSKKYFKNCDKEVENEQFIITNKNEKNTKERKVILFGSERYPNWESIINILLKFQ